MTTLLDGHLFEKSLRSGWYLAHGVVPHGIAEDAFGWVLVVDQLGGMNQAPLGRLSSGGAYSVVIMAPPGTSKVLASAVSASGTTPLRGIELRALSRQEAFGHLLTGFRDESLQRRADQAMRALVRIAKPLLLGRTRAAGDILLAAYQACLSPKQPEPLVKCSVHSARLGPALRAVWKPLNGLQASTGYGAVPEWEAIGEDPQFRLEGIGGPLALRSGWYQIDCVATVNAGRLLAPAVYPDYGDGYLSQEMIRLPEPDQAGRIRALVMFKAPIHSLRFDPSTCRARFVVVSCGLRRMGRVGALIQLLDRCRRSDGSRDWPGAAAALGSFATDAARNGLSVAASRLYQGQGGAVSSAMDYTAWVRLYDTLGRAEHRILKERAARASAEGPLISLLLPVYETPERWLRHCLDSIVAQAYGNWELCVVDDASQSPHVTRVLADYARRDRRIRLKRRERNGHISVASNDALEMATGAYVGLIDHDDELRPHALLEVAELIARHPDAGLVYSDEDKIDEHGRRFEPNFKPDWNPDLLLSQNYICHFTVIRTDLARKVGGFRKEFDGSQDHDLFLRCTHGLQPEQIHHIPKILYHWRAVAGSTALARESKDYASAAGLRAVSEHVHTLDPRARVDELPHGHYRVRWAIPNPAPKVSLIVPTRDRVDLLRMCVESVLQKTDYPNFELVVVDNRSTEPDALDYLNSLRSLDRLKVLVHDAPFNFSAINNWAAARCDGELLCLLNNDIEVIAGDWLEEMVGFASKSNVGAVGAMLHYPDGSIQHAGVILGLGGVANHAYCHQLAGSPGHGARALVAQNMSAVTGACLLVRREVFERVGGLDEHLQIAFNDIDFCLRVQAAGYRNVWTPFATMYHHESASRGAEDSEEKIRRFSHEVEFMKCRWGSFLEQDPAYNPNLSLQIDDTASQLAFPPRLPYSNRLQTPN